MIGHTLAEPIQWMKRIASIWRRHDPSVMGLVQSLINQRMMQSTVNPVNREIGEEHEEAELCVVVPSAGTIFGSIVELSVAADFKEKD